MYVAGKRGDPYVFIQAVAGLISVPLRTGLDVGIEKFTPLGAIGLDLNSIAVAAGSPYRTLKDLLDAARAKPKSISVGITFPGGSAHSMMYRLEKLSGARFNLVSFMNAEELARWLAAQQVEVTQFLTDMGLVLKK